jgi:hypothetical protein
MKWTEKESKFKYNGKPVVRKSAVSDTPFGEFKVYEAVGGNIFYVLPEVRDSYDAGKSIVPTRTQCKSFEEGVLACEGRWRQIKDTINQL